MKFFSLLVFACCLSLAEISQGQNDKSLVKETVQSWFDSFNKHNYDNFFDYITEDCVGINPMGQNMRMSITAPAIFNKAHETLLKNLSIEVDSIDVRFIHSAVAIATIFSREEGTIYPPDGIDRGNNRVDARGSITTMIIVKKNKKWLITQYQSTHIPNR